MHYPLKKLLLLVSVVIAGFIFTGSANIGGANSVNNAISDFSADFSALYTEMNLEQLGLESDVFNKAVGGLHKLNKKGAIKKDDVITIVDFSQPSTQKRLYVLDLANKKVLF